MAAQVFYDVQKSSYHHPLRFILRCVDLINNQQSTKARINKPSSHYYYSFFPSSLMSCVHGADLRPPPRSFRRTFSHLLTFAPITFPTLCARNHHIDVCIVLSITMKRRSHSVGDHRGSLLRFSGERRRPSSSPSCCPSSV